MTGFSRINGRLAVDNIFLDDIADTFGTPLYVYSAAAIEAAYTHFNNRGLGQIHYAVKANSNLAILRLLANLGAGADIVSLGEMQRALTAGFEAQKIIFSGVGKTDAEIVAALKSGIRQINAESEAEINRVLELAAQNPSTTRPNSTDSTHMGPTRLGLRVNPDVVADTHAKIATGQRGAKFGIAMDEIPALYRRIAESGVIASGGLAVHIGSQITDPATFKNAWQALLNMANALKKDGLDVPTLDLGGGFGIDYRSGAGCDIDAVSNIIADVFGNSSYQISLEPGRCLVAEAGVLLTRVVYTKSASDKTFTIVDAAMNDFIRPTLYEAWHRIEPVIAPEGDPILTDIVGPVCETGDYLGLERDLPAMPSDGVLAVMSAGAYGAVMRSNYNTRPLTPEVLVLDGEVLRISKEQTLDALLAQDIIPSALK